MQNIQLNLIIINILKKKRFLQLKMIKQNRYIKLRKIEKNYDQKTLLVKIRFNLMNKILLLKKREEGIVQQLYKMTHQMKKMNILLEYSKQIHMNKTLSIL